MVSPSERSVERSVFFATDGVVTSSPRNMQRMGGAEGEVTEGIVLGVVRPYSYEGVGDEGLRGFLERIEEHLIERIENWPVRFEHLGVPQFREALGLRHKEYRLLLDGVRHYNIIPRIVHVHKHEYLDRSSRVLAYDRERVRALAAFAWSFRRKLDQLGDERETTSTEQILLEARADTVHALGGYSLASLFADTDLSGLTSPQLGRSDRVTIMNEHLHGEVVRVSSQPKAAESYDYGQVADPTYRAFLKQHAEQYIQKNRGRFPVSTNAMRKFYDQWANPNLPLEVFGLDKEHFARFYRGVRNHRILDFIMVGSYPHLDEDRFRALGALAKGYHDEILERGGQEVLADVDFWNRVVAQTMGGLGEHPPFAIHIRYPQETTPGKIKPRKKAQPMHHAPVTHNRAAESIFDLALEDEKLKGKIRMLTREQEKDIARYDLGRLDDLYKSVPENVFNADFVRLGIPLHVAEAICFIYAVEQKEQAQFRLEDVASMPNSTFHKAARVCYRFIEEYENWPDPRYRARNLFELYLLIKRWAKVFIREAEMFRE